MSKVGSVREERPVRALCRHIGLVAGLVLFLFSPKLIVGTERPATASGSAPGTMQIEFEDSGVRGGTYFPGLAKPVTFGANQLSAAEAAELEKLIEASRFFERSTARGATMPPEARNQGQAIITIQQGTRQNTVSVPELTSDKTLKALVRFLQRTTAPMRKNQ